LKPPLVLWLASFSPALPLAAAILGRRRPRGAVAWLLVWCAFMTVVSAVEVVSSRRGVNNHWLAYASLPVGVALLLWILSLWQRTQVAALTFRVAIPLLLLASLVLTVLEEDTASFSSVVQPMASLIALAALAWTLVSRAIGETEPLLQQDWLWICGGMAVYFGLLATLSPFARLVLHDEPVLVVRAYKVAGTVMILSAFAMARGVLCAPRT